MIAFLPNLAGPDGLIIVGILVFLFGAKKIPELAEGLASSVKEFTRAKNGEDSPQIEDHK